MAFTSWRKKRNPEDPDKLLTEMSSVLWEAPENPPEDVNAPAESGRLLAQTAGLDGKAETPEGSQSFHPASRITSDPLSLQREARLQEQMSLAKEAILRSLQTEADTVAGRLRASHSESEALIAKAEEVRQKLQSEVEKSQGYVQEASRQALGSVMEEWQGRISKELEGSSRSLVEQARRQMREEMTAAVEVLSGEACRIVAEKITPSVEAELEKSLRRSAGELFSTLAQTAREEAESSCRSAVATAVDSIHSAAAEAVARVDRLQAGAKAGSPAAEPVPRETSSPDAVLEDLRRKSEVVLGDVQAQLQDALNRLREKDVQQALDHIHKAAEDLLQRSGKELQKLATDTLWSTTDKLNSFASRLVEQSMDRHSEKELPRAANGVPWSATGKHNGLGTRVVEQSVDHRLDKKVSKAISETGWTSTDKGSDVVSTLPEGTRQERVVSSTVRVAAVQPMSAAATVRSEVYPTKPVAGLMRDSQPEWRRHLAGLGLMWWCQTCLWAVVVAVPLFLFIRFSLRPVMRLPVEPPAGFFVASPDWDARERAQEESLSRAYWGRAVRYVQWRYAFGTTLPEQPVPEFNVSGNDPAPTASDSRLRYWRALRSVWAMPQAWQKSYEWDTEWAWHHLVASLSKK